MTDWNKIPRSAMRDWCYAMEEPERKAKENERAAFWASMMRNGAGQGAMNALMQSNMSGFGNQLGGVAFGNHLGSFMGGLMGGSFGYYAR